ncbi:hypothetical protein [Streptomyces milbemycinicus]|uniref:hypothetical protein n=1 Tax=Streptomyces milbemycinicus TaxID=476552 RepID=UPI0033E1DE85
MLDGACVWQREKLPKGVLTSLSQHSVLPAKGAGNGPVRVMAVVSVHADADSADQEMATTLEEVVLPQLPLGGAPCPEQRLNQDERIISLLSSGTPWGPWSTTAPLGTTSGISSGPWPPRCAAGTCLR